jgi:hypothetical protein
MKAYGGVDASIHSTDACTYYNSNFGPLDRSAIREHSNLKEGEKLRIYGGMSAESRDISLRKDARH